MKKKYLITNLVIIFIIGIILLNFNKKRESKVEFINISKNKLMSDLKNISFLTIKKDYLIISGNEKTYKYVLEDKKLESLKYFITQELDNKYIFKKDNKYGILDENLNILIEPNYNSIVWSGLKDIIIGKKNNESYLISLKSKDILGKYDFIIPTNDSSTLKVNKNSHYGYLDKNLKEIISCNYKVLFPFKNELIISHNGNKYGVINKKEKVIVPYKYDEIYIHNNGNILVKENNKYKDFYQEKIISVDKLYPSLSNYLVYEKNNRFGILDLKNFNLSTITYDEISITNDNDFIIVGDHNKYGLVDIKNLNKKITFDYDYITPIGKNAFVCGTINKGLYSLIIPGIIKTKELYDYVQNIQNQYYLGYKDNSKIDIINKKGDTISTISNKNILFYNNKGIILDSKDFIEIISLEDKN